MTSFGDNYDYEEPALGMTKAEIDEEEAASGSMSSSNKRLHFNDLRARIHKAKYQGTDACTNVSELCDVLRQEYDQAYPFVDDAAAPASPSEVSATRRKNTRKPAPEATELESIMRKNSLLELRLSGRRAPGSKRTALLPPVDSIAYRTLHGSLPSDIEQEYGINSRGSTERKKDRSITAGGAGRQKDTGLMFPPIFTPQLGTPTWKKSVRQTRREKEASFKGQDNGFVTVPATA
jgi:hypothetical protein